MSAAAEPARLAVLVSGAGRSLQNLAEVIARGELDAEIRLVVASRASAYGVERAVALGLETRVLRPRDFSSLEAYADEVFGLCRERRIDLVCLMGFLNLLLIPDDFDGRVLNIHPALLPDFGGAGMYGHRVHEAVLEAGVGESGCTVHICNNSYDEGPVLVQKRCRVLPGDDAGTLAARVFDLEKLAYPEALRILIAAGRFRAG